MDAIFCNEEGAIEGAPVLLPLGGVPALFINCAVAMAAEFGKTTSAIDAGINWHPTPSEVEELGPELQEYWESCFTNAPDKPILWVGIGSSCVFQPTMHLIALISSRFVGDYTLVPQRKYYYMGEYSVSQVSRTFLSR